MNKKLHLSGLTACEEEGFALLGAGLRRSASAEKLGISRKTVEGHQQNLKKKLGVTSARELYVRAAEWLAVREGRG